MKHILITLSAIGALALSSTIVAQDSETGGREKRGGRGRHHDALEHMTETLNLTPEQKAKVQPVIDQATPQIDSIHREAMEKTKAVMDGAMAKIRPMLTPEQQQKLDDSQKDRRGGREGRGGRKGHHGKRGQDAQDGQDEPDNL
jgi:Spy/CpxP family protein refolding chaperone